MRTRRHRGAGRVARSMTVVAVLVATACGSSGAAGQRYELDGGLGWKYRITIATDEAKPAASAGGCYAAAPPGRTNQQFTVTVDNLAADRDAPLPDFVFGANLSDDGRRALDVATVENAYGLVEAYRSGDAIDCSLSSFLTAHGATISAKGNVTLVVTVASIGDPTPPGMTLLTRVFTPDGAAHDLITRAD